MSELHPRCKTNSPDRLLEPWKPDYPGMAVWKSIKARLITGYRVRSPVGLPNTNPQGAQP